MVRSAFEIQPITVNGKTISKVVVDDHVEKHPDITDDVVLDLVRLLDGTDQQPDDERGEFEYYVSLLQLIQKQYRLVWLMKKDELFIGVITAYRDSRSK